MQLKRNKEMEFERLKKSHKKQVIIGALAVCVIGGILTFATTRAKYKLTDDISLAKGTINYKPYDFKVMAMYQQNDSGTYTEINTMPTSGYVINEEKTYCTTDNQTQVKGKIKTIDGNHVFNSLKKSDKCYLYFDKYVSPITISDIIATLNAKTTTPTTFASGTTSDEGVYAVSDPVYGGTSYYWRGLVTNNYVKFADKCWRIVRINGDGSIRIIYDGTTCHANGSNSESIAVSSTAYNTSYDQTNYVGWTYSGTAQRPTLSTDANGLTTGGTASNAKTQLESWYSSNITEDNLEKVANGKYCNDREAQSGYAWAIKPSSDFFYAAYKRIWTDHVPSLECSTNDIYTLKVGLITADEVMYAGGTKEVRSSYYLYNAQAYWTMSPCYWKDNNSHALVFVVDTIGSINSGYVNPAATGLRPVINLKSDVTFSSGDGTLNNPYVVS